MKNKQELIYMYLKSKESIMHQSIKLMLTVNNNKLNSQNQIIYDSIMITVLITAFRQIKNIITINNRCYSTLSEV